MRKRVEKKGEVSIIGEGVGNLGKERKEGGLEADGAAMRKGRHLRTRKKGGINLDILRGSGEIEHHSRREGK